MFLQIYNISLNALPGSWRVWWDLRTKSSRTGRLSQAPPRNGYTVVSLDLFDFTVSDTFVRSYFGSSHDLHSNGDVHILALCSVEQTARVTVPPLG